MRPGEHALVVENSFARAFGVRTGDRVRIPRPGRDDVVLRVAGVAVSASQGPAPDWSPSAAWIPRDVLLDEAPRATLDGEVAVQLGDRDGSAAFAERVRRLLPPDRARITEWREIRAAVTARTDSSRAVLQASSLFALIAVGLIVANAIAGRVLAQRRELGILKALGMTPRGLTSLLLVEHLGLAIVAAVVGTAVGTAMSPLLLRPTARLLGTPTPSPFELQSVIAGTVGIVAVVAAFTVLPVWRAGRVPVAEAVGGARGVREASRSRLARAATRLHLPPAVVLGVKDAFARRTRAVLTVSSLALTMALVAAALSTEATFKRVIDDSALRSKPYDVLVEPGRGSDARARALIAGLGDRVRGTYTLVPVPVVIRGEPIQTRAIGGDYPRFHHAIPDGRAIAGPGEVIVWPGAARPLRPADRRPPAHARAGPPGDAAHRRAVRRARQRRPDRNLRPSLAAGAGHGVAGARAQLCHRRRAGHGPARGRPRRRPRVARRDRRRSPARRDPPRARRPAPRRLRHGPRPARHRLREPADHAHARRARARARARLRRLQGTGRDAAPASPGRHGGRRPARGARDRDRHANRDGDLPGAAREPQSQRRAGHRHRAAVVVDRADGPGAVLLSALASVLPARRAAAVRPGEALRYE